MATTVIANRTCVTNWCQERDGSSAAYANAEDQLTPIISKEHGLDSNWSWQHKNGTRTNSWRLCQLTFLSEKLLDSYLELSKEERSSLQFLALETLLVERCSLTKDPLVAGKQFMTRCQGQTEKTSKFVADIKPQFKCVYPSESGELAVLLQHFLTGLQPTISLELLLNVKPHSIVKAVKQANEIEYALKFSSKDLVDAHAQWNETKKISAVQEK